MHAGRRWLLLVAASLLAQAAPLGCGGSGSSGFDPTFLEGLVIEQALDEHTCLPHGELVICAAGASAGVGPPGAPGLEGLRVDASVDPAALVACARAGRDACRLDVAVTAQGLPAGAELRVALRPLPNGAWQVGEAFAPPLTSGGDEPTPVGLEVGPLGDGVQELRLAVLVFVGPSAVPGEVEELASTGARWAFVVAP